MVTCGSEATIVRDVTAEHCRTEGMSKKSFSVLRLKLRPDTPQDYEDIHIRDITLDGVGVVLQVAPWMQYFDLQGHEPPARSIRNVTISDIKGAATSLGSVRGNPGDVIENITIENVDLKTSGNKPQLSAVKNLVLENVKLNGEPFTSP